jgi:hypothetical protein
MGSPALVAYWKPFEAHAVERLLSDHRDFVIDFGAGHTVHEDKALFERVRAALQPFQNVVLLMPDPDVETSLEIMEGFDSILIRDREINRHFLTHPSNKILAKHAIYWRGLSPEETCNVVLRQLALTHD